MIGESHCIKVKGTSALRGFAPSVQRPDALRETTKFRYRWVGCSGRCEAWHCCRRYTVQRQRDLRLHPSSIPTNVTFVINFVHHFPSSTMSPCHCYVSFHRGSERFSSPASSCFESRRRGIDVQDLVLAIVRAACWSSQSLTRP